MKKLYLLTIALTLMCFGVSAQDNKIVGGSMETADEASWNVSELNSDAGSATTEFGYTDDAPSAGSEGCARVTINGVSTGTRHQMVYQTVTIKRDAKYVFDYAVKALNGTAMANSWIENYIGLTEPSTAADYSTANGATAIGGFKSSNWQTECTGLDQMDGTLANDGCIPGSQDTIVGADLFEKDGVVGDDTTYYIGLKIGIWGADGVLEIGLDNVSLTEITEGGGGSSVKGAGMSSLSVFPSLVENELNVSLAAEIKSVKVVNVLGQVVYSAENVGLNNVKIDFSGKSAGAYYVIVTDSNDNVGSVKSLKL